MRIYITLAFAALVSACTPPDVEPPGYRNTSVPLSYTTRSDATRLAGEWQVRAFYPGDESLRRVTYLIDQQGAPAFELIKRSCEDDNDCTDVREIWRTTPIGPNRWHVTNPRNEATRELWVIWVDEGYRTAAIGAPDGRFGWVLDRQLKGGADRIKAATEILEFNGYNTGAIIAR